MASGLLPIGDSGAGPWEALDEGQRRAWRALSAQVLYSVEALRRMEDAPVDSPSAPVFVWTGSAEELAQAMAAVLDVEQLAALSGEVALAWRKKYHAIRTADAQAKVDAEELEVLKKRPGELG